MPGNIVNLTPADIAKWPKPNYDDPERKTWMPAYAVVCWAIGTAMVATRFWLRFRGQAGKLGLDDAFLLPAWIFGTMFTGTAILLTTWGCGDIVHIWDVPPTKWEALAQSLWLGELSFLLCGGFCKVSVLLFYRRLVDGTYSKRWKYAIFAAIAFTVAYTVAFVILLFVNCSPTSSYWRSFNPEYALNAHYKCLDTKIINTLAGIFASLSDLYAVALPCAITWSFSVPRPQKIALNFIFSLGLLVIAASAVRTYYLIETGLTKDVSRNIFRVFCYALLELQLGIFCSSAPTLRVLFRKYLSGTIRSRQATTPSRGERSKGTITVTRQMSITSNTIHYKSGHDSRDMAKLPLETVDEYAREARLRERSYSPLSGRSDDRPIRLSHEHETEAFPLRDMDARGRSRLSSR